MAWAHDCACAWTAAWLTTRGAEWKGPREVLRDPELKGTVSWNTRTRLHRSGHRPDLAVQGDRAPIPIEVELHRKHRTRLEAILTMYDRWIRDGKITGVAYVCRSEALAHDIAEVAQQVGMPRSSWRTDLLDDVRAQAAERRSAQAAPAAAER
jgi:hypothetical protein